jgi:hypothetical protein
VDDPLVRGGGGIATGRRPDAHALEKGFSARIAFGFLSF